MKPLFLLVALFLAGCGSHPSPPPLPLPSLNVPAAATAPQGLFQLCNGSSIVQWFAYSMEPTGIFALENWLSAASVRSVDRYEYRDDPTYGRSLFWVSSDQRDPVTNKLETRQQYSGDQTGHVMFPAAIADGQTIHIHFTGTWQWGNDCDDATNTCVMDAGGTLVDDRVFTYSGGILSFTETYSERHNDLDTDVPYGPLTILYDASGLRQIAGAKRCN